MALTTSARHKAEQAAAVSGAPAPAVKPAGGKLFQKAPGGVQFLVTAMEVFGLSQAELAAALGYQGSAVSHWLATGKAPAVVALAVECLHRRQGKGNGKGRLVLLRLPSDIEPKVLPVLEAFGLKLTTVEE